MRTDLLRRIERLEVTAPSADRVRVTARFVGAKDGKPVDALVSRAWQEDAEPIVRSANEAGEAFEERALDHFVGLDASVWPLVVLFD